MCHNSYIESRVTNRKNGEGLRCLLICDSFGRGFLPYLSLCFSETWYIDPSRDSRYTDDMRAYIEAADPDIIVHLVYGFKVWWPISGF
jgi:hypothetical protein